MADQNRTEKATPRRRHKAREQGQVARSRELPAALAMLGVVLFMVWQPLSWPDQWRSLFRQALRVAATSDLRTVGPLLQVTAWTAARWAAPAIVFGWALAVASFAAQGGFVFAPAALVPNMGRLNPVANLQKFFSLGALSTLLKSMIPMGFVVYLSVAVLARDWDQMIHLGHMSPHAAPAWIVARAFEIAWKASLVFLAWSAMDYMLQRFNFERQLRMSRDEVREESKEMEGNPQTKSRVRRIQRQRHRRFKISDVARATVVVTNPTEYAVALEYRPESMDAPVVLAKGRNLLARKIRQEAIWSALPIVENPPLAQALYRSVEVGQAIPAKLYAAVAEILAFIFRTQSRARPAAAKPQGPGNLLRI